MMHRLHNIVIIAITILTLITVLNLQLSAQEEEEKPSFSPRHYPVNLSLWYPVSINRTKHDSANCHRRLSQRSSNLRSDKCHG
jgi:hypothetical protein